MLKNLNLKKKLVAAFCLVALIAAIIGYFGYNGMTNIMADLKMIDEKNLPSVDALLTISQEATAVKAAERTLANPNIDVPRRERELQNIENSFTKIETAWNKYDNMTKGEEEKTAWQQFGTVWDKWEVGHNEFTRLAVAYIEAVQTGAANQNEIFTKMYTQAMETNSQPFKDVEALLSKLVDFEQEDAIELGDMAQEQAATARNLILIVTILGFLLSIALALFITRLITKPIAVLVKAAEAAAQGDLTAEIKVDSTDEIGHLSQAFADMSNNLRLLIKKTVIAAEQVAASAQQMNASAEQTAQASNQVAASVTDVAKGTEKQTQAVTEISAIVEELSASSEEIAATTNTVSDMTKEAYQTTLHGKDAMQETIEQMGKIGESTSKVYSALEKLTVSSNQIGNIVNVISDIASQTNLLALNAAIEAARAGEHGRGFAVVADEVRKLAEQSQEAAKKITDLIGENHKDIIEANKFMETGNNDVKQGIQIVNSAGKSLEEIADVVKNVSSQVCDISVTIEEMAKGTQTIVSSIENISTITTATSTQMENVSAATQEQAATTEEIASSSHHVANVSRELEEAARKFKV